MIKPWYTIPIVLVGRSLQRGGKTAYRNLGALFYAVLFIGLFWGVYQRIGLAKHFDVPDDLKGKEQSRFTSLYLATMSQTNAMSELTPKTTTGRVVLMLNVLAGAAWMLLFAS